MRRNGSMNSVGDHAAPLLAACAAPGPSLLAAPLGRSKQGRVCINAHIFPLGSEHAPGETACRRFSLLTARWPLAHPDCARYAGASGTLSYASSGRGTRAVLIATGGGVGSPRRNRP